MTPPPLASFGVTPTFGNNFDRFVARGIQWSTATRDQYGGWHNAKVNHAVLYVGQIPGHDKPQLVEARPGGASFADWDSYGDNMIWVSDVEQWKKIRTGPTSTMAQYVPLGIEDAQREIIRQYAIDCAVKKIGYNYLDFVAIALAQKRFGSVIRYDDAPWWAKRLSNPNRLICSQLVDWCYLMAGVHLFDDGRPSGLVSPADLATLQAH